MFERLLSWLRGYEDEKGISEPKPDIKYTKVTRSQFERVITLREDGWSYPDIAEKTGLSSRTCSNVYRKRGVYDKAITARDSENV